MRFHQMQGMRWMASPTHGPYRPMECFQTAEHVRACVNGRPQAVFREWFRQTITQNHNSRNCRCSMTKNATSPVTHTPPHLGPPMLPPEHSLHHLHRGVRSSRRRGLRGAGCGAAVGAGGGWGAIPTPQGRGPLPGHVRPLLVTPHQRLVRVALGNGVAGAHGGGRVCRAKEGDGVEGVGFVDLGSCTSRTTRTTSDHACGSPTHPAPSSLSACHNLFLFNGRQEDSTVEHDPPANSGWRDPILGSNPTGRCLMSTAPLPLHRPHRMSPLVCSQTTARPRAPQSLAARSRVGLRW
jgi:hypothetical protein